MTTFEQLNLNSRISKAIGVCGYTSPTTIQSRSIPDILDGRDLVASAQTGTGKTAAFVLPALHRISESKSNGKPRVLILTPTRELATQITDAVARYGKFLQVNIACLLGGMPYHKQLKALSRSVDIIIATPGRLMDHMERGRVDLSQIEMLILDEADRMLDMGFIDDVTLIAKKTPQTRQTLLFSATVDNRLSQVIKNLLNNPVRIDLSHEKITPTQIKQELYYADHPQHKMRLLQHLLENENMFKAIIFTATKANADRLAKELRDQEYPASPLHGDLKQALRNKTIEQLRRGKIQFLVATDVAARGIDISDITHVINFDLPKFSEDYVHRIGRTGRAGKTGIAISFALPNDSRHVQRIERFIGQKLAPSVIPGLEPKARQQNAPGKSNPNKRQRSKSRFDDRDRGPFQKTKSRPFKDNNFSDKPKSDGGRSRYSDDKPKSFGGKSRYSDDKPRSDGGRSRYSEDKPKSFGKKDRFSDDKPKSFGGKSRYSDDKPKSFGKKDRFSDDKPKSFGGKSRYSDDKPKSFGKKDRFSDDKPKSFGGKSRYSDDKPKSFGGKSRGDDKPRFGGGKPKSNGFKNKSKFKDK
jgi:superfamily II DNA/RNA helicase